MTPEAPADDSADVIELARDYQLILDPGSARCSGAGLGSGVFEQPETPFPVDNVCTLAPRQSGKGSCIEALLLAAAFLFEEKTIACSAHEALHHQIVV